MLITLGFGETRQITWEASQSHRPPVRQYLIANTDTTQTVYVGPADADRQTPDLMTNIARTQISPLQAITVSARSDWWVFNPNTDAFSDTFTNAFSPPAVVLDIIPDGSYWAPSPAQVALQIQQLNLMTESTGQAIQGVLGTPAQDTTLAGVPGSIQTLGAPPYVPKLQSCEAIRQGVTSGSTMFTFSQPGRIWGAHLSLAVASDGTYTPALAKVYAQIITGSGVTLEIIELALSNTNQTDSGHGDMNFNGFAVQTGDTIQIDVNGGTAIIGVSIRASASVLYSVP